MQAEVPFLPVFSSMKRLVRYSLGSVAIGSLIVSSIESMRFILEALRRKLKLFNSMPGSWFGKVMYQTSQGCLRLIGWIIKSVNRNAYIMVRAYRYNHKWRMRMSMLKDSFVFGRLQ